MDLVLPVRTLRDHVTGEVQPEVVEIRHRAVPGKVCCVGYDGGFFVDGKVQSKPSLLRFPAPKLHVSAGRRGEQFAFQIKFIVFRPPTLPKLTVLTHVSLVHSQRHFGHVTPGSAACQVQVKNGQHDPVIWGYVHKNHAVHVFRV